MRVCVHECELCHQDHHNRERNGELYIYAYTVKAEESEKVFYMKNERGRLKVPIIHMYIINVT